MVNWTTKLILLHWITSLTTCEFSENTAENEYLSERFFLAFHACMLKTGGYIEDLAMNSTDVRSFVECCHESISVDQRRDFSMEDIVVGPDGRDVISMSAGELQSAFRIPLNISLLINKFISRQLTAQLPNRRYQYYHK